MNSERKPTKREPYVRDHEKFRRNDPCYCGSGKKFKKCHGSKMDTFGRSVIGIMNELKEALDVAE